MQKGKSSWKNITKYTFADGKTDAIWYDSEGNFIGDGKTTLEPGNDAATVKLGAPWRTPTADDIRELINNCNWEWTELNGVKGYKVTSRSNSKSIFLPAAGFRAGSIHLSVGTFGAYWSNNSSNNKASGLVSYAGEYNLTHFYDRCEGKSVRAVRK